MKTGHRHSREANWLRGAITVCFVILTLVAPKEGAGQDRAPVLRESFRFDVPLLVAKQFENIRGLIEQEEWTAALDALEEVTEETPDSLVVMEPGRYLNAADLARLLIVRLPEAGLAAYRERMDGWAEERFQAAVTTHNEHELQRLLREAYASSFGANALWTLGEWRWERGEIDAARQAWEQLLPGKSDEWKQPATELRYPDAEFNPADVRARLVLCTIAERNPHRAERELAAFRERDPEVTGTLAGRSGGLSDILAELIAQPDEWPHATTTWDWTTFAKQQSRNAASAAQITLKGPVWMIPLAPLDVPNWQRRRPALPETAPLGRYPVAADGGLFFQNGASIRAVRLSDGRPLWPVDDAESTDVGDIYPPFNVLPIRPVLRPTIGVPRFTNTVHQGRLYALTGPSVLTLPEAGLRASPTRLVCLDVATGEGLLKWFQTADDLFPPGWMMTGTPSAAGDRLFLPLLRTDPQLEPAVACLAAEDGSLIWMHSLGQALTEPLEGRVELGHQLLTLCDDHVFISTDLGAVGALDAGTGAVRWAVTYPSTPLDVLDRSEEASSGLMPPLCNGGRLFVKPNDSDELMAIDAESGNVQWQQRFPSRIVNLLGVRGADLLVSGDHLWSVDSATGNVNWRFGFDDPAGFGYGRGAVSGDRVFWTTHDDLYVIDRQTGSAVQRYPLQELLGVSGGHIVLSQNRLIIAGRDHVTAFELSPVTAAANHD